MHCMYGTRCNIVRSFIVASGWGCHAIIARQLAELCGTALGAHDYLALSERFHTVILSGIPQLGPERRNEARRFVILIDVLYDNGVKLVASAATAVAEIYPAGDGGFEFQRTVSRLIEMQSAAYFDAPHRSPTDS